MRVQYGTVIKDVNWAWASLWEASASLWGATVEGRDWRANRQMDWHTYGHTDSQIQIVASIGSWANISCWGQYWSLNVSKQGSFHHQIEGAMERWADWQNSMVLLRRSWKHFMINFQYLSDNFSILCVHDATFFYVMQQDAFKDGIWIVFISAMLNLRFIGKTMNK